jgi:hypothetical protein
MYNSTLSLTSAVDGGEWSTPCPSRFTPGKETRYYIAQKAGWPPLLIWTVMENLPPAGFNSWTVQPVVSHYTVCTVSTHSLDSILTMLFWLPSHLYVLTVQRSQYTVSILSVHCQYTVSTLSVHCRYTVHTLSIHCQCTDRTLSVHCQYTAGTLSVHCP